jgi:hypothetical protein
VVEQVWSHARDRDTAKKGRPDALPASEALAPRRSRRADQRRHSPSPAGLRPGGRVLEDFVSKEAGSQGRPEFPLEDTERVRSFACSRHGHTPVYRGAPHLRLVHAWSSTLSKAPRHCWHPLRVRSLCRPRQDYSFMVRQDFVTSCPLRNQKVSNLSTQEFINDRNAVKHP